MTRPWIALLCAALLAAPAAASDDLNQQLAEAARTFATGSGADRDVLLAKQLDRSKLDFGVDSLLAVDRWLAALRESGMDPTADDKAGDETMIRAGAYVGEVIRRCSRRAYTWQRHADFLEKQPSLRTVLPYTFGTQFLLAAEQGMTMPINKVVRFLDEGPQNSLHFYAKAECVADRD